MTWALAAVLLSAACAGTANILQAREARQFQTAQRLSPALMVGLVRRSGYRVALALLAAGMVLALYALRLLPVFLVQAGRAASLGVTAVLSVLVLGTRPRRSELAAVGVIAAGLVALAVSTGPSLAVDVPDGPRLALVVSVAGIAALAAWASRSGVGAGSGLALAVLAGLSYAILAVGARILRSLAPLAVLTDPTAYTMAIAGLLGLLLSATAMQRASAVTVTAATVGTETVVAAILGLILCGDRPASDGTASALAGFVLVLAGALALARFGGPLESPGTTATLPP